MNTGRPKPKSDAGKVPWSGQVTSVQPRIRLLHSFNERSHSYLGYVIVLTGEVGSEHRDFSVSLGEATFAKHRIRVDDLLSGCAEAVVAKNVAEAREFLDDVGHSSI